MTSFEKTIGQTCVFSIKTPSKRHWCGVVLVNLSCWYFFKRTFLPPFASSSKPSPSSGQIYTYKNTASPQFLDYPLLASALVWRGWSKLIQWFHMAIVLPSNISWGTFTPCSPQLPLFHKKIHTCFLWSNSPSFVFFQWLARQFLFSLLFNQNTKQHETVQCHGCWRRQSRKDVVHPSVCWERLSWRVVALFYHDTKKTAVYKGKKIQVALGDTDCREVEERVRPFKYPHAGFVVVGFSVDNPQSHMNVKAKWMPEIRQNAPHIPVMLMGTKTDLRQSPEQRSEPGRGRGTGRESWMCWVHGVQRAHGRECRRCHRTRIFVCFEPETKRR